MAVGMLDLIRPYFFAGFDLGAGVHHIIELLHVDEYDSTWDENAVVIWGIARIDTANSQSSFFSPQAGGGGAAHHPGSDWVKWEWHDSSIRFRITIARKAAESVSTVLINTSTELQDVLEALAPNPGDSSSDFPNTQFRLELMFEIASIAFPKLIGAKLDGFVLVKDPDNLEVNITLPRVMLTMTQDSGTNTSFDVGVGSFGAETMDDSDQSIATLLSMNPPYALFPREQFGFGFRKAVLDLSNSNTPLEILDQFGIGDDWKGIYLPDIRFFASTQRTAGVAFNVGARELLIGLAPQVALWGEFNIDVDLLGDQLKTSIRLFNVFSEQAKEVFIQTLTDPNVDFYKAKLLSGPNIETENYVLFVDINSGAAPFVITAVVGQDRPANHQEIPDDNFFNDPSNNPEDISATQRIRLFSQEQRVAIRITSRNPQQRKVIVLDIYKDYIEIPIPQKPKIPRATLLPEDRSKVFILKNEDDKVVLQLIPANGELKIDGNIQDSPEGLAEVLIGEEQTKDIGFTWSTLGEEEIDRYTIYFPHDISNTSQSTDRKRKVNGQEVTDIDGTGLAAFVKSWEDGTDINSAGVRLRVDAYASREKTPNTAYNDALSRARRAGLIQLLHDHGIPSDTIVEGGSHGNNSHPGTSDVLAVGQVPGDVSATARYIIDENYDKENYRIAVTSLIGPTLTDHAYSGILHRDAKESAPPPKLISEPPAPQGQHPDWLRHIGGTVRFEKDFIPVAAELRLTIDYKTAHEEGLEKFRTDLSVIGPGLEDPDEQARLPQGEPNPDDGVVEFRLTITYDRSTQAFTETLVARAAESDRDGLWSWGTIPSENATTEPESDGWRDVLGIYFALAPLLAETASDAAAGGSVVPLAVSLAAPIVITGLGVVHVLRFTHYGVELNIQHDEDEFHASLLFDVESALWLNLKIGNFVIVSNRPDKPVKIRYKAVGFAFDDVHDQPIKFLPVFDSSRGYTLDLAESGSLKVLPSLGDKFGDIIQVLGARIARTNPLNIEVELGMGVDLGVFTVDRFGFRLPVDPLGTPSITAIGVSVDIPEVLTGKGYLQIDETGFTGQLDLTVPNIGIRVAGGLSIRTATEGDRSATATFVSIAVEFPSGIPLGGTGLAIFGLLGIFAMHHRRNENPGARNPALDWLVNSVQGDPTDVRGWEPKLDQWAFGVGIVAGTMEGGTVLNLKGMIVLELPGPRIILFVKGDILKEKPPTKGTESGALFAVVDINPQRVLIGLQFEYHIERVLDIVIPVEAGFYYDRLDHFYLDAGTIEQPAIAKILGLFDGTAYFMIHGDGIPAFPLGALQGFSVAAGFSASFVWGNTSVGLFLRIRAGFDVGIGFKPLLFAGRVFIEGELRLFIVSIEARGELIFRSNGNDTRIEGRICGRVSFFFFSVSGCVGFSIGDDPGAPPVEDPIRDLMLQSRSAALLEGSGVDRGIDNILCKGTTDHSVPTIEVIENDETVIHEVYVPIDAIPLIQFEVAPSLATGADIDGDIGSGLPVGAGENWQKRGEHYVRYTLQRIKLKLVKRNGAVVPAGTPPVTEGPKPFTWRHPMQPAGGDGMPVELALLDWKPTNVDKALVQGAALDNLVDSRWGKICQPVAKASRVLWTFRHSPMGLSFDGWKLEGEAWPDKPGTYRSSPVNTKIRVTETWRTNTFIDGLLPTKDATVVGISFVCPRPPRRPLDLHTQLTDRLFLSLSDGDNPAFPLSSRPIESRQIKCIGKVLQAPYELLADSFQFPDLPLFESFKKLDEFKKESLRDVVSLTGGPFKKEMVLLICARIKMVIKGLIKIKTYARGRVPLPDSIPTFHQITEEDQLPGKWTNQEGPWWDDVKLTRAVFSSIRKQRGGWGEYLVRIPLDQAAFIVEIGVNPLREAIEEFGMTPPSWYLGVVDALAESEIIRESEDEAEATDDQEGLESGLANTQHAMLFPASQYEVTVVYDGEVGGKREDPQEGEDPEEIVMLRSETGQTSTRTFYTDAEPPRSLDPWLLAQSPSQHELYHFFEEPVVVVFATNNVLELYKAYNKDIRAVAKAASFRGSAETPEAVETRFNIRDFFMPMEAAILSPWQATVRRRLGSLPCGQFDPDGDQHGRAVLPFLLDPLTDYVVDMEMINPNGTVYNPPALQGEVGKRPLSRHHFTTSRFATREAFANEVYAAFVENLLPQNPAALLSLAAITSDNDFDRALMESGLGVTPRPNESSIAILWSSSTPAQPLAVYLTTPEPVWRLRKEPKAEYDASGEYILRWTLEDQLWLSVDELVRENEAVMVRDGGDFVRKETATKEHAGLTLKEFRKKHTLRKGDDPPPVELPVPLQAHNYVDHFVHDISGTRTLAILKPNTRGKTVSLGLARKLNPILDTDISDVPMTLCEILIQSAPWEE